MPGTPSLPVHIDNGDIRGQGAEGQQPHRHCVGQKCRPVAQGTKVNEDLHDKGLGVHEEHRPARRMVGWKVW